MQAVLPAVPSDPLVRAHTRNNVKEAACFCWRGPRPVIVIPIYSLRAYQLSPEWTFSVFETIEANEAIKDLFDVRCWNQHANGEQIPHEIQTFVDANRGFEVGGRHTYRQSIIYKNPSGCFTYQTVNWFFKLNVYDMTRSFIRQNNDIGARSS